MWSFERRRRTASLQARSARSEPKGSRSKPIALAVFAALALSGCTVQPLYGPIGTDAPLAAELQAVAVDPIPDRIGHYVRNELIFALNGTGSDVPPRYRLMVALKERVQTPILDTVTGRATSATVVVDAEYRLIDIADEHVITKGIAFGVASYDRFSNRLANVRAARDGEIRDAKVISDMIRTRVATALSK
ncbi:MAG TPA: LPS assembly lipoprotein LptE [Methylosinus sp.]|jgi:LPS-assembly lipoprotein|uniref:LPS assembly lipoprotein LptE n=1 Tax=Methylosinus sp. TaxID=427 RepID=UPI002F939CF4